MLRSESEEYLCQEIGVTGKILSRNVKQLVDAKIVKV